MTADELYKALKEIERASDAVKREELLQAIVMRLIAYDTE